MNDVLKISLSLFYKISCRHCAFQVPPPYFLVQNVLPAVTVTTGTIHFTVYHEEGSCIIL
jgi:hypothetical protein